jgi:glycopeptide antibiotics resistance protein
MQKRGTLPGKTYRIIFMIFFIMYVSFLAFLTILGRFHGGIYTYRNINIIPFKTILQYLTTSINPNISRTNILGNIEAFMPMGFLLPILFKKLRKFRKVLLVVLIVTFSIEILQYITGTGASDVDDVILNVLGGILGYLIYGIIMKIVISVRVKSNAGRGG